MPKDFVFPDLGEGVSEGELVRWLVKEGDEVKEDQEVAEVETDKALVTIPSPLSGKVKKLNYREGDRVKVGTVLMTFDETESKGETPDSKKSPPAQIKPEPKKESAIDDSASKKKLMQEEESPDLPPLAAPYTRKIARELGVDLKKIQGSGPHGRITEQDVRHAAETTSVETKSPSPTPLPSKAETNFEKYGKVEHIPIKGIRRKISEHMLLAAQQAAMVTHIDEAEVDRLLKIKNEKAQYAKERGVKLTLLPFLIKAAAIAMKDYPYLNASLNGDEIILKHYYHFGFAVDTEAGLIVPVIRDVDQKSILHLAKELETLSAKACDRSLGLEELKGHSFSITNIGSIGGKAFTPIIHYPDSAILGVGRTYEKPVVRQGQVAVANVMPLCLTFDHRITDGATAARFVNEVIKYLQDPDLLLLDDGE